MRTILVSGASGIVGYGTLKSLRISGNDYRLIGTSIYDDSVAPAFCDVFEIAPRTDAPEYVDWLIGIIDRYSIDMIVPGINDDMLCWNEQRQRLERTGVKVMLNDTNLIDLCADKWMFYETLRESGSEHLIESRLQGSFKELADEFGLPFLLKPRRGFASKGIVSVTDEAVFNKHKAKLGDILMAQPIVGDDDSEYTVSAFFDDTNSLCCLMGLRRKLSKEGFTEKAIVDLPVDAERVVTELAARLSPIGPTNFQFRLHEGRLLLLEINPRISSATSIRAGFGYNESDMAARYFLGGEVPVPPSVRNGHAVRYTEDYLFYDSSDI